MTWNNNNNLKPIIKPSHVTCMWVWVCVCSAGLGMYDSPMFLPTHEDSPGGRSVPTTPLQVAAPGMCSNKAHTHCFHLSRKTFLKPWCHPIKRSSCVLIVDSLIHGVPYNSCFILYYWCSSFFCSSVTAFSETHPSEVFEHASQSVPTVSTSTPSVCVVTGPSTAEEQDVLLEAGEDGWACTLDTLFWLFFFSFFFYKNGSSILILVMSVWVQQARIPSFPLLKTFYCTIFIECCGETYKCNYSCNSVELESTGSWVSCSVY